MNIYEKLLNAQMELKAPKGQYNNFGKYKYRSCEDILESLKPVLNKNKLTVFLKDDLINIGTRFYVKATVKLINIEKTDEVIEVTSLAREDENKKGMDGSQITGTASSYARKYALNGLFAIDDTKDSDTDERHIENNTRAKQPQKSNTQKAKAIELIKKEVNTESKKEHLKSELNKLERTSLEYCKEDELKEIYTSLKNFKEDNLKDEITEMFQGQIIE